MTSAILLNAILKCMYMYMYSIVLIGSLHDWVIGTKTTMLGCRLINGIFIKNKNKNKKQIDISFSCIYPVIDNEFRYAKIHVCNIVTVVLRRTWLLPCGSTAILTISWQNSWLITGKMHVDLLNSAAYIYIVTWNCCTIFSSLCADVYFFLLYERKK